MPKRKPSLGHSQSPDPLSMSQHGSDDDDTPLEEQITVKSPPQRKHAVKPTPTRMQAVVEIDVPVHRLRSRTVVSSPSKRTPVKTPVKTPTKTPMTAKKTRMINDAPSPTPNGKSKGKGKEAPEGEAHSTSSILKAAINSAKSSRKLKTPARTPATKAAASTSQVLVNNTPTLASSISKPLPTPSPALLEGSARKRPRLDQSAAKTLDFDNGIFSVADDEQEQGKDGVAISTEVFRANERLKKQREARNFTYEGEANAPRMMRSGRALAKVNKDKGEDDEDMDEYGPRLEEENPLAPQAPIIPDIPVESLLITPSEHLLPSKQEPSSLPIIIPAFQRTYLQAMLNILTSQNISTNPPPFEDEEHNETLQGILNLMKGTVERGEGNSAIVVGPRGSGKTRTVARALNLLPCSSSTSPIIVRLSGHAQTNDKLAIREMGRQIAEAEGRKYGGKGTGDEREDVDDDDDEDYAPTTLPSHLLALLTAPSPRAIIIILEEFDLFTEHARQALLYCLFDVVQSVKTGPIGSTPRGIAVLGLTTRVDTLLLLEKRVKSRFSHRIWRVTSPLASVPASSTVNGTNGTDATDAVKQEAGWKRLIQRALVLWKTEEGEVDDEVGKWKGDWEYSVDEILRKPTIERNFDRLASLTTDVRNIYRPFIEPLINVINGKTEYLRLDKILDNVINQVESAGWGLQSSKLRDLPHPALGILIIAKHLAYAGRDEFNFAQVEEEYMRFSRTRLVGSGKVRWPIGVLKRSFDHLQNLSLLIPSTSTSSTSLNRQQPQFARVRCALAPNEIVAWFKGEGKDVLGVEMGNWGRMMGGHA
ncbi:origin recognition complex subunit 4 [Cryptococcus neoformans Bt1]|nr:origin recognition complex subunit 4 [Cryptococcus neoformans var. grubii Bt1]OXG11892.1 origin recognition complex subunit 4 [Cryptococcus neoformans var. grubii Ze90-1]